MEGLEMTRKQLDRNFWKGKRVLVTGHTGFKGGWLTIWLNRLGAKVYGISLKPSIDPNLFELARINLLCDSHFCDIRNKAALSKCMRNAQPEVVFHVDILGFKPRMGLNDAIQLTIDWYRSKHSGFDPRKLCGNDIATYEALH